MFKCMPFLACNRQVDSLDKRQCNLDHIPEEVTRYARSLEELLLGSNHIKELNKPLFRLTKLRTLQLCDNEIFKIPPEIANLAGLVELDLSKNDISDIPDKIQHCSNLRGLNIGSNPITRLPAAISQLRSLTTLGLSDVSLTQLPADIGNLCNLRELELRENLLRSLPQSIAYLAQLQRLDLGANELSELPAEMGQLTALQELYVDTNDLEWLPREIGALRQLQVLDASENKLESVPDEVGELAQLQDLTLSQNSLEHLPHSVGKLKKLSICKVDKNRLIALTPAIGSCGALTELILTENLIPELPSSVGNLQVLANLNLDKNQLKELPSTIGACRSLAVLSLRDNSLGALPMEVGKLEKLRVLDVSGNRLPHLPFTIGVLTELQALWLSENQSQPLLKLQTDQDSRGVKILTCYLLPQRDADGQIIQPPPGAEPKSHRHTPDREGLSGPGVRWVDQPEPEEEDKARLGSFQRHDTPHPKPGVPRNVAAATAPAKVDGHVIHSHGHTKDDAVLDLAERRRSKEIAQPPELPPKKEATGGASKTASGAQPPVVPPRRSLSKEALSQDAPTPAPRAIDRGSNSDGRCVVFNAPSADEDHQTRLKRKNTPHHLKHAKLGDSASARDRLEKILHSTGLEQTVNGGSSRPSSRNGLSGVGGMELVSAFEEQTRTIHRHQGGLGLSIAGGTDSPPFNPDKPDDEGIFISKVTEGGPADRAGLKKGDKLLAVNGNATVNVPHTLAVEYMKKAGDAVVMKVGRSVLKPSSSTPLTKPPASLDISSPDASFASSTAEAELLTTSIRQDPVGGPGFSIAGGKGAPAAYKPGDEGIFISYITPGGSAERSGKLRVGDRVLSINGTNMKAARHDQAVALLTSYEPEMHLVLSRSSRPMSPPPSSAALTPVSPSSLLAAAEPPLAHSSPLNTLTNSSAKDSAGTELIRVSKASGPLGLTIVGGSDHSSQPFGGPSNPGVFVSKIVPGSNAARTGRLRVGDRLLAVGDSDVTASTHQQVVKLLQQAKKEVALKVRHDPPPAGLREVRISKESSEPLGINICGGVGAPPANPLDRSDEGIFVEEVHPRGAAARQGSLRPGTRILEVNDASLLGCSQEEAAKALKKAGAHLKLLICQGFDGPGAPLSSAQLSPPRTQDDSNSPNTSFSDTSKSDVSDEDVPPELKNNSAHRSGYHLSESALEQEVRREEAILRQPISAAAAGHNAYASKSTTPSSLSSAAAVSPPPPISPKPAALSPKPPALPPKGAGLAAVHVPPPVAPKPKPKPPQRTTTSPQPPRSLESSSEDALSGSRLPSAAARPAVPSKPSLGASPTTPTSSAPGESLDFGSKIRRFQSEIKQQSSSSIAAAPSSLSASKIPTAKPAPPPPPPKKIHLVSGADIQRMRSEEEAKISAAFPDRGPAVVRTKKAENRLLASSEASEPSPSEALSPAEQRAAEAAKRAEWRAARLKSLESDALKAESMLKQVIRNDQDTIHEAPEDFPPPPPPLMGQSGTSEAMSSETTEAIDPETGARTRTTVTTLTQHSQHTVERSGIDFIDDGSSTKSDSVR